MKRRTFLAGGLSCCLAGLALPEFGADEGEHPRSVLEGVAALGKPLTYTETKIPLGELVRKVADDTGATLAASKEVADEPVAVVVKDLPARELLDQLAGLLDYRWRRRGKEGLWRYEIYQDMAGKQREEALRQATLAGAEKRFREEMDRVREIAALSQDQIRELNTERERFEQEYRKLTPEQQEQRRPSPEGMEQSRRWSLALRLGGELPRLLAKQLTSLSAEQWAALRQEQQLVFSTEPGPGEQALSPEMARALRAAPPTVLSPGMRVSPNDPGGEERARQHDRQQQEQWAAASGYRVQVQLDQRAFRSSGALSLSANASPFRTGAAAPDFFGGGITSSAEVKVDAIDWSRFVSTYYTPERRAKLENDPVVGAKKVLRPEAPLEKVTSVSSGTVTVGRLRDLLPDLARTFGVQFIGDAYWEEPGRVSFPFLSAEPIPLFKVLDWAPGSDQWEHEGNLVRIRARTWFFRRPREIPLRLVRRWKSLCEQHGVLPLAELERAATSLTDTQIDSLRAFQQDMGVPEPGLAILEYTRSVLRLYAALSQGQRQALWQGQALLAGMMTPAQRALFAAALREALYARSVPLDAAQLATGSLSLSREKLLLTRGRGAGRPSSRIERASTALAQPGEAGSRTTNPPDGATRYSVTAVTFHFSYGPETRENVQITVASLP